MRHPGRRHTAPPGHTFDLFEPVAGVLDVVEAAPPTSDAGLLLSPALLSLAEPAPDFSLFLPAVAEADELSFLAKSVTYQPVPFNWKAGAAISLRMA